MRRFLNSISFRLTIILLIPTLAVLLTGVFVLFTLQEVTVASQTIFERGNPIIMTTRRAEMALIQANNVVASSLLVQPADQMEENIKRIEYAERELDRWSKQFFTFTHALLLGSDSPEFMRKDNGIYMREWRTSPLASVTVPEGDRQQKKLIEESNSAFGAFLQKALNVLVLQKQEQVLLQNREFAQAAALAKNVDSSIADMERARNQIVGKMDRLLKLNWKVLNDQSSSLDASTEMLRKSLIIPLLVAVASLFIGLIVLRRMIVRPIVKLTKVTEDISKGKFDVKLDGLKKQNELGDLARAFDRTVVSLKLAMRNGGAPVEEDHPPGATSPLSSQQQTIAPTPPPYAPGTGTFGTQPQGFGQQMPNQNMPQNPPSQWSSPPPNPSQGAVPPFGSPMGPSGGVIPG